jgi:hypothetical protein
MTAEGFDMVPFMNYLLLHIWTITIHQNNHNQVQPTSPDLCMNRVYFNSYPIVGEISLVSLLRRPIPSIEVFSSGFHRDPGLSKDLSAIIGNLCGFSITEDYLFHFKRHDVSISLLVHIFEPLDQFFMTNPNLQTPFGSDAIAVSYDRITNNEFNPPRVPTLPPPSMDVVSAG